MAYGAMQSWVACQKRRRRRCLSKWMQTGLISRVVCQNGCKQDWYHMLFVKMDANSLMPLISAACDNCLAANYIILFAASQKRCHFYFCINFGKCRPILIVRSLLNSQIYCGGSWDQNDHLTSSLLPHYLVPLILAKLVRSASKAHFSLSSSSSSSYPVLVFMVLRLSRTPG